MGTGSVASNRLAPRNSVAGDGACPLFRREVACGKRGQAPWRQRFCLCHTGLCHGASPHFPRTLRSRTNLARGDNCLSSASAMVTGTILSSAHGAVAGGRRGVSLVMHGDRHATDRRTNWRWFAPFCPPAGQQARGGPAGVPSVAPRGGVPVSRRAERRTVGRFHLRGPRLFRASPGEHVLLLRPRPGLFRHHALPPRAALRAALASAGRFRGGLLTLAHKPAIPCADARRGGPCANSPRP